MGDWAVDQAPDRDGVRHEHDAGEAPMFNFVPEGFVQRTEVRSFHQTMSLSTQQRVCTLLD